MFSPLMTVVWLAGLRDLFRRDGWKLLRPIGWMFVVTFVFFLFSHGKSYYLAGPILPLLAAGCVVVAERFKRVVAVGVVLVLSAVVAWPAHAPRAAHPDLRDLLLPADRRRTSSRRSAGRSSPTPFVGRSNHCRTVPSCSRATTARPVRWSGTTSACRSTAATTAGATGGRLPTTPARRRRRLRVPRPHFTGCERAATDPEVDGADNEEAGSGLWVCDGPRVRGRSCGRQLTHLDA